MGNIEKEAAFELGTGIVAKKDNAILALLPDGQRLEDLTGRLSVFRNSPNDGVETYCLDGMPLIQFFPVEFSTELTDDGVKLTATQRHRTF